MGTMLVTKNVQGKLVGWGQKGAKAYARFKRKLAKLEPGELVEFSYWVPRNGPFHRMHFGMLGVIFENQDTFTNREVMREYLEIGAGHAIYVKHGRRTIAIAESISYWNLDDDAFEVHHKKVKQFVRTIRARRTLWPHMTAPKSKDMIESLLQHFDHYQPGPDVIDGEYEDPP